MASNLVSIDNKYHRNIRIKSNRELRHAATLNMAPAVIGEFANLALYYPTVLVKDDDTGQFRCVALFGFEQGENLYWRNQQWNAAYAPMSLIRQPFFVGLENVKQKPLTICLDMNSEYVNETEGELLFEQDGQQTPYLKRVNAFLTKLVEGTQQTEEYIDTLLQMSLIMPLKLDIRRQGDSNETIEGLYGIDERKFDALSEQQISELHQRGYLKPICAQLISLNHFQLLLQRRQLKS